MILPAVDMKDGQAVQLVQGVDGSQKVFGEPLEAALGWENAGAKWLHLVDLDRAFGKGSNAEIAAEIIAKTNMSVELTGGIRDDQSLEAALTTGCARVNIGTAAVEHPHWAASAIAKYGERVAIALDVKDGRLATRGWVETGGKLEEALSFFDKAGCTRYVVTDVGADGMMQGPNLELLRHVAENTTAKVTASGGISTLDDLRALATLHPQVDAAIVGSALYLGKFTLEEALSVN
ncbi:MAG: bifunctional 1-(5-phosphoribosyl)-5-((5-phosphoribosylamino)methylideneamino)imidazole-4-carboxamide isomerase/phosphoribosylanthranilate isomerase PriA [Propionibacteriaceae bacterium]|nr:bifunctional 1-(5-phosphoribosyl)-5-((5-phosphoribosylamino)methylideneamino)imidazole-4-carboxamide isomerase/phosphoribosylanthranilate isomerase PriA [Propionibacteriaceae bacterium]